MHSQHLISILSHRNGSLFLFFFFLNSVRETMDEYKDRYKNSHMSLHFFFVIVGELVHKLWKKEHEID